MDRLNGVSWQLRRVSLNKFRPLMSNKEYLTVILDDPCEYQLPARRRAHTFLSARPYSLTQQNLRLRFLCRRRSILSRCHQSWLRYIACKLPALQHCRVAPAETENYLDSHALKTTCH